MPVIKSKQPDLDIVSCNILDWLFPVDQPVSEQPLWIDANDPSNALSPKQALHWVKRLAVGLQRHGVRSGDACLIFTPNHIFVPVAYMGTVCLGAAFSGASPAFTVNELVHQITAVSPKVVFVHPSLRETVLEACKKANIPQSSIFLVSDVENASMDGLHDWRTLMASAQESKDWRWPSFTPKQAQSIIGTINFSSGTTGLPKGVAVTHHNLISNVSQIASIYNYSSSERWLGFLPLYHAYGQAYAVLNATKNNIPIYIMKHFVLEEFLRNIQTYKITRLQSVPPIMIMLDKRPEVAKYDLSSVREILCGAAPLSKELQHAIERKFKVRVTQGWGLSETTCAATGVPWDKEPLTGSVGMLLPSTEVRLVDDEGREVGVGERGEVYVRGPQIAVGYWGNEKATAETFGDGWLRTGDVAVINEEGYIWIVDRKKVGKMYCLCVYEANTLAPGTHQG